MKALFYAPWAAGVLWGIALFAVQPSQTSAQTVTPQSPANDIRIEALKGRVEVNRGGNTQWVPVVPGHGLKPGDRVRTLERSSVFVRWSDQSVVRLPELSDVQILPPGATQRTSFSLITGLLSFFNRERLTNARYGTRTASAAIRGTEFVLQAEENGRTTLTVIEGEVELSNDVEPSLILRTGEQGVAEPGQAPRKAPAIIVNNVIQWALYYPAVLDVDELGLTLAERNRLATSLVAYKSGELLRALDLLPAAVAAESSAEKIYRAGLLLAVGNVAEAEQVLNTVAQTAGAAAAAPRGLRLADALRTLIAAVKLQPSNTNSTPELAGEWLAQSYSHQSRGDLRGALRAARKSVEISADFGFGWTRVAELEFSFGHTSEAREALERGLLYSPRNAQGLALKGFVLAAQNRISEAISWFNRAITVDPNLANAWLGRGLCLIRQGHSQRGREDLLTAVAMEPQRAILRSYLAKAYTDAGDEKRAAHEIQIAKDIDPNDPTAWLYSALLNEQENRINGAVRDLEKSQELTGNRQVYRSDLLLDQDRAVRSANLARIYQDAGMFDVAIREASRAVSYDYANYSAHLFLANSYDSLRDPNRINLRYETPAEAEYLIANLLAPVGAGILSQTVSQQEYSKLFERDRFGVASTTEYLSRGAWTERGAQFGTYQNSSYMFEGLYRWDPGQRPNNDFEETELRLHLKQQLTPHDTVYLRGTYYSAEGGDVIQYFDPNSAYPNLRTKEWHDPDLLAGYHHEWNPGSHTLLLVGRLDDRASIDNPAQQAIVAGRVNPVGDVYYLEGLTIGSRYRTQLEMFSTEAQQLWRGASHDLTVGGRYQWGDFETDNFQTGPSFDVAAFFPPPPQPAAAQDFTTDFERLSLYVYDRWQPIDSLLLVGGVSYDRITFPENFRSPPISDDQETMERVSPKAGVVWNAARNTIIRSAYTRSLAGPSVDQSFQIEPTQVAGFNQSFRSLIPESVAGANVGAQFETYGISVEQTIFSNTYLALGGEVLNSKVKRTLGAFLIDPDAYATPSGIRNHLDYDERTLLVSLNQLLGNEWSVGVHYGLSDVEVDDTYPETAPGAVFRDGLRTRQNLEATLHRLLLHANFNHPSGFFARTEALWILQQNNGYGFIQPGDPEVPGDPDIVYPEMPDENFWHLNAFLGYRFARSRAEVTVGLLNITDEDYMLNPLTLHNEFPRERTFVARLAFAF
jgi:tetratricopeptide (TPR) repeat protein